MLLSNCAPSFQSAVREAFPPLAVDLKALETCEAILTPPELPAVTTKTDAVVAWMKDDAALQGAIGTIHVGRECVADVRGRYAPAKGN